MHAAERPTPPGTVVISGSSTVYPFSQAAIRAFTAQGKPERRWQAKPTGTTAGLREFCAGASSITAASRPINTAELKACGNSGVQFLELPVAFDAITVVVNPANGWARQISTAELRRLWSREAQGRVLRWQQVNPAWPNKPISLCGPGRDSGTYDTFNKAINGQADNSRQDVSTSENDDDLVRCVSSNPLALGYFGFDYYRANRASLRALAVESSRGPVLPSEASVQNSRYQPLSRPLFFYVSAEALKREPEVRNFIRFSLERGGRIAREAGVVPLQDATYRLVLSKLYRQVLGSAFAGDLPVGLSVGQTLGRSFDALKKPQYR
jgi:phosphate transport system substrate-binding protein